MGTKHRLPGEGSLFRLETTRPDGTKRVRWRASVSYGGRSERAYRTRTCRTREEAKAALRELLDDQGARRNPSRQSLGDYLRSWLADTVKGSANTRRVYEDQIAHLEPIAGVRLDALTADDVERTLNGMTSRRKYGGGGPASAKTVRNVHSMLRTALQVAVDRKKLRDNVALVVAMPELRAPKRDVELTPELARAVLAAIAGDRMEAAYALCFMGLREGEVLGLRAPMDLGLDGDDPWVWPRMQNLGSGPKARMDVLKTAFSDEPLVIAGFVASRLRAHLERERTSRKVLGADGWLVFVSESGYAVNASWFSHHLEALCRKAGLPLLTPHDLRHGAATLLAVANVHPRVAQHLLRHASERTTSQIYTHVTRRQDRQAADALDRLIAQ